MWTKTHMQTHKQASAWVCMCACVHVRAHPPTPNRFLLFQQCQSVVLITDKGVWPLLISPFMSLNGELPHVSLLCHREASSPVGSGCFCLGETPLRSPVSSSGYGLRENHTWNASSWGETLEGVGSPLSHSLLVFPSQVAPQ